MAAFSKLRQVPDPMRTSPQARVSDGRLQASPPRRWPGCGDNIEKLAASWAPQGCWLSDVWRSRAVADEAHRRLRDKCLPNSL